MGSSLYYTVFLGWLWIEGRFSKPQCDHPLSPPPTYTRTLRGPPEPGSQVERCRTPAVYIHSVTDEKRLSEKEGDRGPQQQKQQKTSLFIYLCIHHIYGKKERPMSSSGAEINDKYPQKAQDQDQIKHSYRIRPSTPRWDEWESEGYCGHCMHSSL